MAYVQPNGRIQLFRGINLDNRYMHTIYFANEAAQDTWFSSKVTYTYNRQSYTRQNENVIRLKVASDVVADCSYLRFQNKDETNPPSVANNHSTKWYYAFITSVNYINEGVTEITFEIDVMQTWFIQTDHIIRPCMVLRNHIAANEDRLGYNLEVEPIGSEVYDMDEITCQDMEDDFDEGYHIVVQTTADPFNPPQGYAAKTDYITNGIFNGLYSIQQVADANGGTTAANDIHDLLGSWDANEQTAQVLSIIQFPSAFLHVNAATQEDTHNKDYKIAHPLDLGNYHPQNIKLYGYPYAYLYVTTMDGDSSQYRWEYFTEDVLNPTQSIREITFHLSANEMGGGLIALYPEDYNGVSENFDAKVVMDNFPKCAYSYDAYQAWVASGGKTKAEFQAYLAKMRGSYALEQVTTSETVAVANSVIGVASAGVRAASSPTDAGMIQGIASMAQSAVGGMGAIASAATSRKQIALEMEEAEKKLDFTFRDARYQPNTVVGTQSSNIAVGTGRLRYRFFSVHVRKDELVRLDDFLTVFGYAINKVQQPKLNVGKYWTFVKTEGCIIGGNMPSSSKEAISRIIDGGIFFWNDGDNVGNFEVENRNQYGALVNR